MSASYLPVSEYTPKQQEEEEAPTPAPSLAATASASERDTALDSALDSASGAASSERELKLRVLPDSSSAASGTASADAQPPIDLALSAADSDSASTAAGSVPSAATSTPATAAAAPATSRYLRPLAWFSLIISVLTMSAVGPTFVYVQRLGVAPLLASNWRCQCMLLFLVVPAAVELWGFTPKEERWKWLKRESGSREYHV